MTLRDYAVQEIEEKKKQIDKQAGAVVRAQKKLDTLVETIRELEACLDGEE